MNLNLLRDQLGMSTYKPEVENLNLLIHWVQQNLSQDIQFSGTEKEQLASYEQLVKSYWADCIPPNENTIFTCALRGFDRVITTLHPRPEELNRQNAAGMSPLHLAAIKGHVHTTSSLLTLGANAAVLNHSSQYPLFSALILPMSHNEQLITNKIAIFKLLQAHNPTTIKQQDNNGDTVLQQLALHHFSSLLNEVLAEHSELAYLKNNHTHYPIHTAVLNNQADNVNVLLALKDVASLVDSNGWVALHYAARAGTPEILTYCCQATQNIDMADAEGRTPLMLAASLGNLPNILTLIAYGANVNVIDNYGFTVLHHAVESNNERIVNWLVENTDININAKNYQQKTALALRELNDDNAIK